MKTRPTRDHLQCIYIDQYCHTSGGGRGQESSFQIVRPIQLRSYALCLGKNSEEREGKGGERACRQTFEAAISPSCNHPADHLSVRSLSVNQFCARVTPGKIKRK